MFSHTKIMMILVLLLIPSACSTSIEYPLARTTDIMDSYHGLVVPDPYRWLEDPDSEETRKWIEAQNLITTPWLESIDEREMVKNRLTELWNYERYSAPFKRGDRYFFSKNDGLQNQNIVYWTDSLDKPPRVLVDPNTFSEDGAVALAHYTINADGKWLVYGKAVSGSDWNEWHVRNINTGEDLEDHLKWIKFATPAWDRKGKGFFYSRYDEPAPGKELQDMNYFQKVYYHKLGTPQKEDVLVYERKDHKDWIFKPRVSDDANTLILSVGKGTARQNLVYYRDAQGGPVKELISEFKAMFNYVDNEESLFWFFTDYKAPRGRLIEIDLNKPEEENWRTIIPEGKDVLKSVNLLNNRFVASYLKDARSQIKILDRNGKFLREVALPGLGSAGGFGGKKEETETFYRFSSFSDPGTVYRYDMETGKSSIFRRPDLKFNPEDYITRQVFYQSKDKTKVPMFITHKKDMPMDGNNPVILYGYGGFNASMTPYFSTSQLMWMELGGVFAQANLRGGGEYGRKWHEAGMKLKKQNTFDDFIAAGEWLIRNKYTSNKRLAIQGASNGGLLVGACMVQRPDLFGACLPDVGVMDMLRFNKFTIGWAWESDYGSPQKPDEFKVLYGYSPYHNIKDGVAYPPTLISTADHDDRVVPAHSFKFAARLQAAQKGDAPILIRIETKAGHGGGKPTSKRIEEACDTIAFLIRVFEMDL